MVNELSTNTVKYALQKREIARIEAGIAVDENMIQITFQDDGPGYPEEVIHLQRHNVGLDLIQQLMRRNLHGEWSLHNDEGAVTILRFPHGGAS